MRMAAGRTGEQITRITTIGSGGHKKSMSKCKAGEQADGIAVRRSEEQEIRLAQAELVSKQCRCPGCENNTVMNTVREL